MGWPWGAGQRRPPRGPDCRGPTSTAQERGVCAPAQGPPSSRLEVMVEWLNGGTTGRKRRCGVRGLASGPTPAGRRVGRGPVGGGPSRFPPLGAEARLSPPRASAGHGSMGSDRRGARGPRGRGARGRDGPVPTRCVQAECFDPLVRNCVACKLLRTPEPRPGKSRPTQPAGQQGCSPGKEGGPPPRNLREPQATRDGGGGR